MFRRSQVNARQFEPVPFEQRRGVELVDIDIREVFARQRVVLFVHLVQRLHRIGILVRPEGVRGFVHAALQPDDQIVQARTDVGVPLVGGPARLDVAGHEVGFGNQFPQGAAIHIGIRIRSQAGRQQFGALHRRNPGFRRLAQCEQNLHRPQNLKRECQLVICFNTTGYTILPSPITVNNGSCLHKAMTVS